MIKFVFIKELGLLISDSAKLFLHKQCSFLLFYIISTHNILIQTDSTFMFIANGQPSFQALSPTFRDGKRLMSVVLDAFIQQNKWFCYALFQTFFFCHLYCRLDLVSQNIKKYGASVLFRIHQWKAIHFIFKIKWLNCPSSEALSICKRVPTEQSIK